MAAATREGRAAEHTASCWRRTLLLLAATGPLSCRAPGPQGDWLLLLVTAVRLTQTGSPAKLRRDKEETAAAACMLAVPVFYKGAAGSAGWLAREWVGGWEAAAPFRGAPVGNVGGQRGTILAGF